MGSFRASAALLALALALAGRRAAGVTPIPVGSCRDSTSYFDIDSLRCTSCPDGQRADATGYACECARNTYAASVAAAYSAGNDPEAHCLACDAGLVSVRARASAVLGGSCLACGEGDGGEPVGSAALYAQTSALLANTSAVLDGPTIQGAVDALIASVDPFCANTTGAAPTLGACIADAAPEARCVAPSDVALGAECACPAGFVLAESNSHGGALPRKTCERCAPNAFPSPTDPRACVPCDDPRMEWDGSGCACPDGWAREAHDTPLWGRRSSCVLGAARSDALALVDAALGARLTYTAVVAATSPSGAATTESLDSATVTQLLTTQAAHCLVAVKTGRPDALAPGRSACQAVANLCVLADYDPAAPACRFYRAAQAASSGSVNGEAEWRAQLPWLYYADAAAALAGAELALTVRVSGSVAASGGNASAAAIRLVLNSYSLNGTWLGLTNLTTQLDLCNTPQAAGAAYLAVGASVASRCVLSVGADLAALAGPLGAGYPDATPSSGALGAPPPLGETDRAAALRGGFHELFVLDDNDELYPVPVRVLNYAGAVNLNARVEDEFAIPQAVDEAAADDVLTRRFFLIDALSGRKVGAAAGAPPDVVRFAQTLELQLRVSEAEPSRALPPLLIVGYADALVNGADGSTLAAAAAPSSRASPTVTASFAAGWRMTLTAFWRGVVVAIALGMAVVACGAVCASLAWARRNQRVVLDAEFWVSAVVHALGAFADVFFWLLVLLCGYWYVFFKRQQAAFLMLPDEADCGVVVLLLALCLVGKGVQVLSMVYKQGRADVFLIDWETAHGTLLGKGGEPADEAPVSVWRALFVANELNELQAERLVKPAPTLLIVLLFMVVLDFEGKYATAVPGGGGAAALAAAPSHLLLRFAVGSFVYLCALAAQALVARLVYVPYVEDKMGQLVDLLAVANVSALILPEPLCGYYLHGRSVHAHADASMLELHEQLRAEEDGLTAHRGLTPSSTVQTFQVHLTPKLRELYDETFLAAALVASTGAAQNTAGSSSAAPGARANGRGGARAPNASQPSAPLAALSISSARRAGDGFRSAPEASVARYVEMNALLREFVDGTLQGHEYNVREKTYAERLLGLPPPMWFARESLFLYDSTDGWTRALLYGREYDLALFEVLVYTVCDMSLRSSVLSAIITYASWLLIQLWRSSLGSANIAKKTLIDDRFLI